MSAYRYESDSLGKVKIPYKAYYGPQTQRAVENFPVSGIRFGRSFLMAMGYIKKHSAIVNGDLGLIPAGISKAIQKASQELIDGKLDEQFPLDIYQTGSGTSTNMNANEVIAKRAVELLAGGQKKLIHPNDHVNFGQSSNDVIPTAIRIAAVLSSRGHLLPSAHSLIKSFEIKQKQYGRVVKTGRTHLMDAMPVTFGQMFSGYAQQLKYGCRAVKNALNSVSELPLGGTAVGTGINTHPKFGALFASSLSQDTGVTFKEAANHFEAQGSVDAPVEVSGAIKRLAVSVFKICNDLRWMNSGPNAGLGEIELAALQPGSSIMPGKVNPVIEESTAMVCAQVVGNDAAITLGAMSGNFELNVMLPLVAHNLLESIRLLGNACTNLGERSVSKLNIRQERVQEQIERNPILVTALNPVIGYDLAAKIAKRAFKTGLPLLEVAKGMCDIPESELKKILDPIKMTRGGFIK
jgi:fumarate hydratase class II